MTPEAQTSPNTQLEPTSSEADTKTSLLDAAEKLFAALGVERASLRAITQEAGANLAAVHYHFGSKEGLVREVFARRLAPLNRDRLEMLDEVERRYPVTPPLREVLTAFLEPALRMIQRERGGHEFARFVCRTFSEADDANRTLVLEQFREVAARFHKALGAALPELPAADLFWRFHFMVGSMVHTAGLGYLVHHTSDGLCDPMDVDGAVQRLTDFLEGGFSSPSSVPGEPQ